MSVTMSKAEKPAATKLTAKVGSEAATVNTMEVDNLPEFYRSQAALNTCVVSPARPREKTTGGIILANDSKEASEYAAQIGRIEAIGPLFYSRGSFLDLPEASRPKVGDYIMFKPYVGRRFEVNAMKFVIISDVDILLTKIDPSDDFKLFT